MSAYRKRPVVVQATRWFRNGDHPLDYSKDHQGFEGGEMRTFTGAERKAQGWEGDIVRYFRRPDVPGGQACKHCGLTMHVHGWIDTLEGGHVVCPGDWIITGVKGENYPCKSDIFAATYDVDEGDGRDYRKERDAAYRERNQVVAALARVLMERYPPLRGLPPGAPANAWLAEHDPGDVDWDPEWRTIVFIESSHGQLSWHLHDSDVALFDGLPRGPNLWDGHTTEEKYARVARIGRPPLPCPPGMGEESRRLHREYLTLMRAQYAGAKNGADVVRLTDACAAKGIILVPGGESL